jgi:hypothetical protein
VLDDIYPHYYIYDSVGYVVGPHKNTVCYLNATSKILSTHNSERLLFRWVGRVSQFLRVIESGMAAALLYIQRKYYGEFVDTLLCKQSKCRDDFETLVLLLKTRRKYFKFYGTEVVFLLLLLLLTELSFY